jgi:hypothetical protein
MGLQKIFSGRFLDVMYITVTALERTARKMFCAEFGGKPGRFLSPV